VGSGSDEESFPPVTYRVAMPGHHGSRAWSLVVTKASCTYETPQPTQTPSGRRQIHSKSTYGLFKVYFERR